MREGDLVRFKTGNLNSVTGNPTYHVGRIAQALPGFVWVEVGAHEYAVDYEELERMADVAS